MKSLNDLSSEALRAAMRSGTQEWGRRASIFEHAMYIESVENRRFKCRCGCGKRATHRGMANGICMTAWGCELSIRRSVKQVNEQLTGETK